MPAWGRAASVFSTFTESAGRAWLAPLGSGRPVSGAVGGAAEVVVGRIVVVVGSGAAAFESPPPQAASVTATRAAKAVAVLRRRVCRFTPSPVRARSARRARKRTD